MQAAPAIGVILSEVSTNDCKKISKPEAAKKSCGKTECSLVFCCFKLQALVQKQQFLEIVPIRSENIKWSNLNEIYIYLRHKDIWQPPENIITIS